jgi:hypothetical protein
MRLCISGFELFTAGRENATLLLDQVKVRRREARCHIGVTSSRYVKGSTEAMMRTRASNGRSSFGMKCVQCSNELVAPERSEYWSDKRACHIWHCRKCSCCFESLVLFPADTK